MIRFNRIHVALALAAILVGTGAFSNERVRSEHTRRTDDESPKCPIHFVLQLNNVYYYECVDDENCTGPVTLVSSDRLHHLGCDPCTDPISGVGSGPGATLDNYCPRRPMSPVIPPGRESALPPDLYRVLVYEDVGKLWDADRFIWRYYRLIRLTSNMGTHPTTNRIHRLAQELNPFEAITANIELEVNGIYLEVSNNATTQFPTDEPIQYRSVELSMGGQ